LVGSGAFGEAAEELEEFCTEVLAALGADPEWQAQAAGRMIVFGVTEGEDPRDFLRTASRSNAYTVVRKLWREYQEGEEVSTRIPAPKAGRD
jgi:hypothetical protein